jgi:acyl-CoA thioester hydrolase
MQQSTFRHTHRVAYADCTVGNHVYYARYLDLLEIARNEFFRSLGQTFLELQNQDTIFPVLECRLRYKSPAHYDDLLSIELWPTCAERVRLNLAYRILNQAGTLLLEGETFHACANVNNKPKRLPEKLRERLLPFLRPAAGVDPV